MWWVKDNPDHSRGGFQNRDVGKSFFDNDFGPDFGVDYARYADPSDPAQDAKLAQDVITKLNSSFNGEIYRLTVLARNGFIILKGQVNHFSLREQIANEVWLISGVKEVINQVLVAHH